MTPFIRTIGLVAAALVAALASQAMAEDVIVKVPVHLENLPEGAEPGVICDAIHERDATTLDFLGSGETAVPEFEGAFEDTVEVAITFRDDSNAYPEEADEVWCRLVLSDGGSAVKSFEECTKASMDPGSHPLICGPRGASVRGRVEESTAETLPANDDQ